MTTPTECRNETYERIKPQLNRQCEAVYNAYLQYGASTTIGMANASGISLLTLRPRVTDLMKMGAIECVGRAHGHGIYRARTPDEWQAWIEAQKMGQGELELT